jgi:ABC-type transport system involved in multi-copper enzyme maturation permease subunit
VRNVFTIAGRELRTIFTSPVAYVVLTGFLILGGWFFFNLVARFNMLVSLYTNFRTSR